MLHDVTPSLLQLHRRIGSARLLKWLNRYSVGQSFDALQEACDKCRPADSTKIRQMTAKCKQQGIQIITILDPEYPSCFRSLENSAPPFLYIMGDSDRLLSRTISVIGMRKPTMAGRTAAGAVSRACTNSGWLIVSGNAPGVDSIAHHAALEAGGATLVFPPVSMDQYSPSFKNDDLKLTTVVSPFPLGSPVEPWMFLRRNTLVALHCRTAFVAETGTRGGTLDTVRKLHKYSRPVFATAFPEEAKYARAHEMLAAGGVELLQTTEQEDAWLPNILNAASSYIPAETLPVPILDDMFPDEFFP